MVFLFAFRSVSASYEDSLDLKGIKVYRYTLQPNTLAAPNVNPDNQCYCRDPKVTKNCTMAGVLDISSCQGSQFAFVIQSKQEVEAAPGLSSDVWLSFSEQINRSTSPCPTFSTAVRPCESPCWASLPAQSTTTPSWTWNL